MTYQSEQELEELLIVQLQKQGYSRVNILNEDDLKVNFREQLNIFNDEKLEGSKLTDKEFDRIMIHLEGKSIFNSSKLFRDKFVLECFLFIKLLPKHKLKFFHTNMNNFIYA